jgi:hypothetical protein
VQSETPFEPDIFGYPTQKSEWISCLLAMKSYPEIEAATLAASVLAVMVDLQTGTTP